MKLPAFLARAFRPDPTPDLVSSIRQAGDAIIREREKDRTISMLSTALMEREAVEAARAREEAERSSELDEMMMMGGGGPWRMPGAAIRRKPGLTTRSLKESTLPYVAQGAYGDTELMLNNIEWKRETSLSWLEFTRWGIQQIILISRLRCLKDPMLQRGMNVSAQYVFGRGVEITSDDPAAAEYLQEWIAANQTVFGHSGLSESERAKYYDGNLFWCCFTDRVHTGMVNVRLIDAVEILDVITNPDDTSEPWYYRREWIQQQMAPDGARSNVAMKAWYPALSYEPTGAARLDEIDGVPVMWESPVYHRKCGAPGKWHFGMPLVYAALGYAQAVKRFLEDCMTIRNSLAQYSMILTVKGGQQAMQGAKTQLATTVGPSASLWDQNPTAVAGSIFVGGSGVDLKPFPSKGAGGDPAEVREYKLMVCMVFGLPESFFADMNTSNLATATSLDRPTELNFREKQAVWEEDLTVLATHALKAAAGAPSGKLREARRDSGKLPKVKVIFPTIIEADVPARVGAIVNAITLGNKGGEAVGLDEKTGVQLLTNEFGVDNSEELIDSMYPDTGPDAYDPVRKPKPEPALNPATGEPATPATESERTALRNALSRLSQAVRVYEAARREEETEDEV